VPKALSGYNNNWVKPYNFIIIIIIMINILKNVFKHFNLKFGKIFPLKNTLNFFESNIRIDYGVTDKKSLLLRRRK